MKVFRHETHTVYEVRGSTKHKFGICIIHETGHRFNARTLWNPKCWKFIVRPGGPHWHWYVLLPVFKLYRDNCNTSIGHPNLYLWIIR